MQRYDELNRWIEEVDMSGLYAPWKWAYMQHKYGFNVMRDGPGPSGEQAQINIRKRLMSEDFTTPEAKAFEAGWNMLNDWWKHGIDRMHKNPAMDL